MQKTVHSDGVFVPEAFIQDKMMHLNDAYIKVYLHAKYLAEKKGGMVSCDALYKVFGEQTLVQEALRALVRAGCLFVNKSAMVSFAPSNVLEKPRYAQSQISTSVDRDAQLQMLMQAAEKVLGKMLTASSAECLYGLYDWLGLPTDVILKLLEYCAEIGKKSMAYIEKVAISWHKDGIVTLEAAEKHIAEEAKKRSFVYKAKSIFGIDNRNFTTREETFLHKWQSMGIDERLLGFGFDYTVDNTGKLSFAYLDKVLCAWMEAGVKTPEQAQKFIDAYKQGKAPVKKTPTQTKVQGKPGIYDTKKYDYEEIRRLARKNIRQKLGKE